MIVSAFAALVASGGAPRASIAMGEKKTEDAEKILGNCFFLQIIVSVILTAALLIFNRPLLLAFGASENTIEYACDYMNIYAIGTIFVQLTLGMNAFVTAQGYSKIAMLSVVIGAIANLSLDPLLIYGFGMGVKGAALATVISQSLSTVWVVLFLFSKKALLRLKVSNMKLSPRVILPCLGLGLATFMMQASESVISVAFNSSLLEYGGDIAVGAMTILSSVMQFAMLPMNGIAQGAQPILSYNYGAKNAARVKKTYRLLLIACLIYSVSLWSTIMLFPRFLPSIFTPDAALIDFTAGVIRIYFGGLIIFGAQIACQMTFVSLGKALSSVTVAVVRKFVLLLPLIYLVPQFMSDKALGVYTAEPIADVIAVSFTVILFVFQFKKAMEKIK
jgi:putative MATE family efflux protein